MSKNSRAFVTGAEGFIGSRLARFLQSKRWAVMGGRFVHRCDSLQSLHGVRFVQCDLRNGQRVEQLIKDYGPTHIFHLGAQSLPTVSWADPIGTFESNIMGSLHVFEAARHISRPPVIISA